VLGKFQVIERFQIEDLVVQDSTGVLFRALDAESGQQVALRRLFPFGPNGGGLNAEEQADYQVAIARLAEIHHPSLRAVICGGCDPIDGMPFIATEWIEGTRLQVFLERAPLGFREAADLLAKALDVSEILSQVLGQEGVWVETDPRTIVVGAEGTGRGVTFWISPLKWLGKNDGGRGLQAIVTLTEEIKGWHGKAMPQTGNALGDWLKWLRGVARTATLHEARERLAGVVGKDRPIPTQSLVRHATAPKRKGKSILPAILTGVAVLAATVSCGWLVLKKSGATWGGHAGRRLPPPEILETGMVHPLGNETPAPPGSQSPDVFTPERRVAGESQEDRAHRRFAELTATAQDASRNEEARLARQQAEIAGRNGVFRPEDRELLLAQKGNPVVVEGVVRSIDHSQSGKTMYLLFSTAAGRSDIRGSIITSDVAADLAEPALAPLLGKKIRLHGRVKVEKLLDRPVIEIKERTAIEVLE
jgi:hypothetical protein